MSNVEYYFEGYDLTRVALLVKCTNSLSPHPDTPRTEPLRLIAVVGGIFWVESANDPALPELYRYAKPYAAQPLQQPAALARMPEDSRLYVLTVIGLMSCAISVVSSLLMRLL